MNSKTNKIIITTGILCLVFTLAIYILWPIIFVNYLREVKNTPYLDIIPKVIEVENNHLEHPYNLGLIKYNITNDQILNSELSDNKHLKIEFEKSYLLVLNWGSIEEIPQLQYNQKLKVFNTTTNDVELFKNIDHYSSVFINLILKHTKLMYLTILNYILILISLK